MKPTLTLLLAALTTLTTFATEDAEPIQPAEQPAAGHGNCDLMASNTVRAIFRGVQMTANGEQALFEVVQNLAHKRVVRYGDGMLPAGMVLTISMDRQMPGQPSSIVDEIRQMQIGDEAVMKIDHIFLFDEPQGVNLRPCTRLARKPATPAVTPVYGAPQSPAVPVQPVPVAPTPGSGAVYGIISEQ